MATNKIGYKVNCNKPYVIWINSGIINERLSASSYNQDYLNFAKAKSIFNFKKVIDIAKVTAMIGWKGLTTDNYVKENGVYLLRTVDIKDNFISLENAVMAEKEKVYEQPQIILKQGDIIFSKDGTLGVSAVVPRYQNKEMCVGSTLARIRLNPKLDSYYVCAALMSKIVQAQIMYFVSGIAQPHITQEYINKLEIPIPSPEIQKYIGDKVRKAEELREEAKRLKKEAEEIFNQSYEQIRKSDSKFEWVNSNYLNEDNIIPNFYKQYELLKDKKHEYIEFENIVESIKCGIPVRSDMRIGDTYPFYGASGVTDNIGDYNFDGEYLIVAQDGSIGSVNVARNKFWANNHVWVVQVKEGWNLEFLELYLNKYNYWISLTTGSVVPKVTSENLKRLLVPKIDYEIQRSIGNKISEVKYKEENFKILIEQAKKDVEDLIEGNFDMSKVKENN